MPQNLFQQRLAWHNPTKTSLVLSNSLTRVKSGFNINDLALWGLKTFAIPMWVLHEEAADFSEQKLLDIPPQEKSQRKHQAWGESLLPKKLIIVVKE